MKHKGLFILLLAFVLILFSGSVQAQAVNVSTDQYTIECTPETTLVQYNALAGKAGFTQYCEYTWHKNYTLVRDVAFCFDTPLTTGRLYYHDNSSGMFGDPEEWTDVTGQFDNVNLSAHVPVQFTYYNNRTNQNGSYLQRIDGNLTQPYCYYIKNVAFKQNNTIKTQMFYQTKDYVNTKWSTLFGNITARRVDVFLDPFYDSTHYEIGTFRSASYYWGTTAGVLNSDVRSSTSNLNPYLNFMTNSRNLGNGNLTQTSGTYTMTATNSTHTDNEFTNITLTGATVTWGTANTLAILRGWTFATIQGTTINGQSYGQPGGIRYPNHNCGSSTCVGSSNGGSGSGGGGGAGYDSYSGGCYSVLDAYGGGGAGYGTGGSAGGGSKGGGGGGTYGSTTGEDFTPGSGGGSGTAKQGCITGGGTSVGGTGGGAILLSSYNLTLKDTTIDLRGGQGSQACSGGGGGGGGGSGGMVIFEGYYCNLNNVTILVAGASGGAARTGDNTCPPYYSGGTGGYGRVRFKCTNQDFTSVTIDTSIYNATASFTDVQKTNSSIISQNISIGSNLTVFRANYASIGSVLVNIALDGILANAVPVTNGQCTGWGTGKSDTLAYFINLTGSDATIGSLNISLDTPDCMANITFNPNTAQNGYAVTELLINITTTNYTGQWQYSSINLYNYTGGALVAEYNTTQSPYQVNVSLPDGTYKFNATAYYTNQNITTETRTVTLDTTPPTIAYNSFADNDGYVYARRYVNVGVDAEDAAFANLTIYLYNSTGGLIDSYYSTSPSVNHTFTVTSDGTFMFNATAYSSSPTIPNTVSTTTRRITANENLAILNYAMNENGGSFLTEISGNNWTADVNGATNTYGKIAYGRQISAAGMNITGVSFGVDDSVNQSYTFWIKTNQTINPGETWALMERTANSGNKFGVYYQPGVLTWLYDATPVTYNINLTTNQWYFITLTYDVVYTQGAGPTPNNENHWLKLNGNTINYGLSGTVWVNNSAMVYNLTNGKPYSSSITFPASSSKSLIGTVTGMSNYSSTNGTVAFWVYTPAGSAGWPITEAGSYTTNFGLGVEAGGAPSNASCGVSQDLLKVDEVGSTELCLVNDTWSHVVATWNSGSIKVYQDGINIRNYTGSAGVSQITFSDAYTSGTAPYFNDFRIYNFTATQEQINYLYNNGAGTTSSLSQINTSTPSISLISTQNLTVVLKMDETSGIVLINNVSGQPNSTLGDLAGFRTVGGFNGWGINYTTSAVNKSATVYGVSGNFSSSRRSTDSIWFKTNTTFTASVSGEFLSYILSGGEYAILSVGLNTPNKLEWSLYSSGYQVAITCPNNADNDQWHNAVVTIDGSGNDTLYMDGVLCGSQAHYVPYFEVYPNLYLHTLAPNYNTATDTFWGALDEYYHWDRVLTPTEVLQLASTVYPFSSQQTVIPYYRIDSTNGAKTQLYTRVTVPASGTLTLYLNKATFSTTQTSNSSIFDFFDDFNGNAVNTTNWDLTSVTSAVSGGVANFTMTGVQNGPAYQLQQFGDACTLAVLMPTAATYGSGVVLRANVAAFDYNQNYYKVFMANFLSRNDKISHRNGPVTLVTILDSENFTITENNMTLTEVCALGYNYSLNTMRIIDGQYTVYVNDSGIDTTNNNRTSGYSGLTDDGTPNVLMVDKFAIYNRSVAMNVMIDDTSSSDYIIVNITNTNAIPYSGVVSIPGLSNLPTTLQVANYQFISSLTPTTAAFHITGYVNAQNVSAGNSTISVPAGNSSLTIGSALNGSNVAYGVKFDEYSIWNRRLNTSQIEFLYANGAGMAYPFTTPAGFNLSAYSVVFPYPNNGYARTNNFTYNFTTTDPFYSFAFFNMTKLFGNGLSYTATTVGDTYTFLDLPEGKYYYSLLLNDRQDNSYFFDPNVTLDITIPYVEFQPPTPVNGSFVTNNITAVVHSTDNIQINSTTVYLYNTTGHYENITSTNITVITQTAPPSEYAWFGSAGFTDLTPNGFNFTQVGPYPPIVNTTFTKVSGKSLQNPNGIAGSKSGAYANTTMPTGNKDMSFCSWIYAQTAFGSQGVGIAGMYFGGAGAGTAGWFILNGADGYQIRIDTYGAPASTGDWPAQNVWTHVCYVYNASSTTATIYENGGASNYTGVMPITPNMIDPAIFIFNAGYRDNVTWDSGWAGYMDDLRFYNKTITGAEASFIYNNGNGTTLSISEMGLVTNQTNEINFNHTFLNLSWGTYYLSAIATDNANWTNTTETRTIIAIPYFPASMYNVTFWFPDGAYTPYGASLLLTSFTTTDPYYNHAEYNLTKIGGTENITITNETSLIYENLTDGVYVYSLRLFDNALNNQLYGPRNITIDATAPTVTYNTPPTPVPDAFVQTNFTIAVDIDDPNFANDANVTFRLYNTSGLIQTQVKQWNNCTITPANSPLNTGLKAYYSLNNPNPIDNVSLTNFTVNSGVWNATGKVGGGYTFDGTGNVLAYTSASHFPSGDNNWSYALWVNFGTLPTTGVIKGFFNWGSQNTYQGLYSGFGNDYGSCSGYGYSLSPGMWGAGGAPCIPYNLTVASWHHVVYTFDRTTGNFTAYIDGVFVGSGIDATTQNLPASGQEARLGSGLDGGANTFIGSMDELGVWNRTLTASEVSTLYNSGSGITYPFSGAATTNCSATFTPSWGYYTYDVSAVDLAGNEGTAPIQNITVIPAFQSQWYNVTFPYLENAYTTNNTLIYGFSTIDPHYANTTYTLTSPNTPSGTYELTWFTFDQPVGGYPQDYGIVNNSMTSSGGSPTIDNTTYKVGTGGLLLPSRSSNYFGRASINGYTDGNHDMCVMYWANWNTPPVDDAVWIAGVGSTSNMIQVGASLQNNMDWNMYSNNANPTVPARVESRWYHFVESYTASNNNVSIWQNGTYITSVATGGGPANWYFSNGTMTLGSTGGNGANAYVDDFRVFNQSCDQVMVDYVYNNGNGTIASVALMSGGSSVGNVTTTNTSITFGPLIDGKYYYALTIFDKAGNSQFYDPNVTIDTTPPVLTYITPPTPTDGAFLKNITVEVNVTEINLANVTLSIYNNTGVVTTATQSNCTGGCFITATPPWGSYYFNATAYDLAGNTDNAPTRNVTVIPAFQSQWYNVTFPYPENAYTSNNTLTHGFTTVDPYYSNTTYSITGETIGAGVTCYQPDPLNQTTCGADGTGMIYTELNFTYNLGNGLIQTGAVVFNYTKPAGASNASYWIVQMTPAGPYHLLLPGACWNMNSLELRVLSQSEFLGHAAQCYNGTDWHTLISSSSINGIGAGNTVGTPDPTVTKMRDEDFRVDFSLADYYNWGTATWRTTSGGAFYNDAAIYEEALMWNFASHNTTTTNTSITYNLTDGRYYYALTIFDKVGNNQFYDPNVTIDTIAPFINFTTPTDANGSYIDTRASIIVNLTLTDTNLNSSATLIHLYNTSSLVQTSTGASAHTFTNLTNGQYYFNATAYDYAGNTNSTETRTATIDYYKSGITFDALQRTTNAVIPYNVTITGPINATFGSDGISRFLNIPNASIVGGAYRVDVWKAGYYNCTTLNWTANSTYTFPTCLLYDSSVTFTTYDTYTNATISNFSIYLQATSGFNETLTAGTSVNTGLIISNSYYLQATHPSYLSYTNNAYAPQNSTEANNIGLSQTSTTFRFKHGFSSQLINNVNVTLVDTDYNRTFTTSTGSITLGPEGVSHWIFTAPRYNTLNATYNFPNGSTQIVDVLLYPILNVSVYDEHKSNIILTYFNWSHPTLASYTQFCLATDSQNASTVATIISNATPSAPFTINTSCVSQRIRFNLEYLDIQGNVESYYRTLIFPATIDKFDFRVFLPDYLDGQTIALTSLKPYDIFGIYTMDARTQVIVTKIMPTGVELITSDYVDATGSMTAFLLQGDQYQITITADNAPTRVIGPYGADSPGVKILRLFDVTLTSSNYAPTNGIAQTANFINVTENQSVLQYTYVDTGNYTTQITMSLLNGTCENPASPIPLQQYTTTDQITIGVVQSFNVFGSRYMNQSSNQAYCVRYDATYRDLTSSRSQTTMIYDTHFVNPGLFSNQWTFPWIIFLVMLLITLGLNARTVSYGSILVAGLAMLFYSIHWYATGSLVPNVNAGVVLGLALLIAIVFNIKRQF